MPATESELRAQLDRLDAELDRRAKRASQLDQYTGVENCPLPEAIVKARITNAYRLLMGMSNAPWGSLVVDAVTDRLIPTGIRSSPNTDGELERLWGDVWQDNHLDADSLLAHDAALTHGRAFAIIWPATRGPRAGKPVVTIDGASQVVIEYAPGSRRERTGALRRWVDDTGRRYWTLYRMDGIYKFVEAKTALSGLGNSPLGRYQRREVAGEPWPVRNPYGLIPVVELPVNCKLKPGVFPYARGEFEGSLGLLDRINTLTFLGLVVAFWMGFPLRAVIGDKIKREVLTDDDGNALLEADGVTKRTRNKPPFQALADGVAQFEDPQTRLEQFDAADRKALSIYGELDQLASVTKTPRYYLPVEGGMSNISADTVWATDGSLVAKMPKHKGSLGEGWEEVLRIGGIMLPEPITLSERAELMWLDHEHRTMAERADAAVKLKDVLPWQLNAELILNLTQDQITRGESSMSSNGLAQVVNGLLNPNAPTVTPPALEPAQVS